jgi:predicted CDP-diglyceride synthetase/phosphatidate cytidylyltransferase
MRVGGWVVVVVVVVVVVAVVKKNQIMVLVQTVSLYRYREERSLCTRIVKNYAAAREQRKNRMRSLSW